jgi:hypothetical protein
MYNVASARKITTPVYFSSVEKNGEPIPARFLEEFEMRSSPVSPPPCDITAARQEFKDMLKNDANVMS